jgi:hypothetical protein
MLRSIPIVSPLSVEINDIRGRSVFPEELLRPWEEAAVYSGGTDHIDFRMTASGG